MHNIIYCMHTMQVTGNDEHARFPIFRFEQVLVLLIGGYLFYFNSLLPSQDYILLTFKPGFFIT